MWGIDLNVITSCQNPLNWIGFFAVGVLLQQAGMKSHILFEKRRRIAAGISAASLIIFSISYFLYSTLLNITPSYWNAFSIVFELNACVVIYYLSLWLAEKKAKPVAVITDVGRNSYPLFFSHMQIGINAVNVICLSFWDRVGGVVFAGVTIFRGVLVIAFSYMLFVVLARKIIKILLLDKYSWLIGL